MSAAGRRYARVLSYHQRFSHLRVVVPDAPVAVNTSWSCSTGGDIHPRQVAATSPSRFAGAPRTCRSFPLEAQGAACDLVADGLQPGQGRCVAGQLGVEEGRGEGGDGGELGGVGGFSVGAIDSAEIMVSALKYGEVFAARQGEVEGSLFQRQPWPPAPWSRVPVTVATLGTQQQGGGEARVDEARSGAAGQVDLGAGQQLGGAGAEGMAGDGAGQRACPAAGGGGEHMSRWSIAAREMRSRASQYLGLCRISCMRARIAGLAAQSERSAAGSRPILGSAAATRAIESGKVGWAIR
jgi:hypothetical protein